ncbi:hypothetical protein HLB44_30800 [Aquincola sp. S2]|uniref:Uncharacterized protein n=1 Tax=Pseudaquabacterium terrae TaxID=2732868 RepID=A0ABX2ERZ0_9BURK|nr:TrbM/KikA/MpfK family conjugal transfer protein [Aquabacterium terrae]NRF71383.1 hypothetical protein [Aquabacterium terrae]
MSQTTKMKNALLAGALSLSAASAGAGVPVVGPSGAVLQREMEGIVGLTEMISLVDNAPQGRSAAPLAMTINERLACEAIVCLSLISQPGPSCTRSLQTYWSVEPHRRVLYLSNCPQAKWFDLPDVVGNAGVPPAQMSQRQKAKR